MSARHGINDVIRQAMGIFSVGGKHFAIFDRLRLFEWISVRNLSGVLTRYPLNVLVYRYIVDEESVWTPTRDYQRSPRFIERFSSAYLDHVHFQFGLCDAEDMSIWDLARPDQVYLLMAQNATFPSGVFSELRLAEETIERERLTVRIETLEVDHFG